MRTARAIWLVLVVLLLVRLLLFASLTLRRYRVRTPALPPALTQMMTRARHADFIAVSWVVHSERCRRQERAARVLPRDREEGGDGCRVSTSINDLPLVSTRFASRSLLCRDVVRSPIVVAARLATGVLLWSLLQGLSQGSSGELREGHPGCLSNSRAAWIA